MDSSLLAIEDDVRSTSTTSSVMSPDDKTRACCPIHPVIQLRRRNRKTGEWKSLLESCPLCDASAFLASEGVQVQAGSSSSSTSRITSRLSEQVSDRTINDSRTSSRSSTSSRRLRPTTSGINPSSSPPRRSSSYQHIPKSSTDSSNEDDERSVSSRSVSSSVYAFASSLPSVSARTSPSTDGPATDDELTEDEESFSASTASDLRRARRLRPALRRGNSTSSSPNNFLSVRFTSETKTPTEEIVADWVNDLSSSSGRLRGLLEGGGGIDTAASTLSLVPRSVLRPSSFGSSTISAPTPQQHDNKDLCVPSLDASSDDDEDEGYDSKNHYDREESKEDVNDDEMIHYHSHDEGETDQDKEVESHDELVTDDEEAEEKETPSSSPVQQQQHLQDILQQQLRNHGSMVYVQGGKWPAPPPPRRTTLNSIGGGSATSGSPLVCRKTHSLSKPQITQGHFPVQQQASRDRSYSSLPERVSRQYNQGGTPFKSPSSLSEGVSQQYNQGSSAQDRPMPHPQQYYHYASPQELPKQMQQQQQQRSHQQSTSSQGALSQLPGDRRSSSRGRIDEHSISSHQGPLPQLSGGRSSSRARGEERSTQQRQQQLPRSQSQSRPRSSSALRGIRNSTSSSLSQSDSNVNGKPITGILRTRRTNDVPIQWQQQILSHQPSQHQLAQLSQFQHQPPPPKPSYLSNKHSTSHMIRRPTLDSNNSNFPQHNTSKSWHNSKDLSKSDSETQESTEPSGESNPIGESNSYPRQATNTRGIERGLILEPSTYDDKGRCMKHPHIRLRKKKLMGGWKVMLINCPDCCIEEMLRMRLEGDGNNGGDNTKSVSRRDRDGMPGGGEDQNFRRRDSRESVNTSTSSKKNIPPITQLVIRSHGKFDDTSVISDTTYNTPPEDLQGSRSSLFSKNSLGPVNDYPPGSFYNGPHCVSRMPFTDAYGDKGWYTGEVASGSGLPHGRGTLHYCDGRVCETRWSNGLSAGVGGGAPPRKRPPHSRPIPSNALVVTEEW